MYLQLKKQSRFNESEFGLQGAVFTQDYPCIAIAEQLEVGTVHQQQNTTWYQITSHSRGVKGSGAGTQEYPIEAMTRVKSTVFDIANY